MSYFFVTPSKSIKPKNAFNSLAFVSSIGVNICLFFFAELLFESFSAAAFSACLASNLVFLSLFTRLIFLLVYKDIRSKI